jgi:hypothetical protein
MVGLRGQLDREEYAMYDWNAPMAPCDWCQDPPDEEVPWLDTEDFWGHAECGLAWKAWINRADAAVEATIS